MMIFDFICSIYSGHHSILIPPSEVEVNPALWLTAVSQYRVRDTFCSYGECLNCSRIHLRECCCQRSDIFMLVKMLMFISAVHNLLTYLREVSDNIYRIY